MNIINEILKLKKQVYFLIRSIGAGNNTLEGLSDVDIYDPSNGEILKFNSSTGLWENGTGSGSGTVTSVSVVSANGLAGTVATATTTPAITLSTSITGILKGNGTAISAAVSGTDLKTINGSSIIGSGDLTITGGASRLDALDDVDIYEPTDYDALVYHGGTWYAEQIISDQAYGTDWNGLTRVAPSKNAVYDKIELISPVGLQDIYVGAVAMWPRTTGGCASLAKTEIATSLVNIQTLDFDQTSSENAQFTVSLPRNWNNGTVTVKFYWTAASGSGDVTWGIAGGAYSNDDALSTALGTAQEVTDTLITANDLHITSDTSALTLAGTPADADFLAFNIYRNISDTLSADAKLLGIVITLTTDAGVAA